MSDLKGDARLVKIYIYENMKCKVLSRGFIMNVTTFNVTELK